MYVREVLANAVILTQIVIRSHQDFRCKILLLCVLCICIGLVDSSEFPVELELVKLELVELKFVELELVELKLVELELVELY